MKLQIQPWPNPAGFMLSVNTHDQVAGLDLGAADVEAFRDLQAENQRLKEAIEQAWDEAGLPTFLRYLRDYIQSRSENVRPRPFRREGPTASPFRHRTSLPWAGRSSGLARPVVAAGGLACARQDEPEGRAAVGRALELDPAAMELDEGLDQAETQADPPLAELVLSRGVVERVEPGEERLEQVRLLAARYADALVLDRHADPVMGLLERLTRESGSSRHRA